jgi:HAMP domain-containing protein
MTDQHQAIIEAARAIIIRAARAIAAGDDDRAITICHDAMKDEPEAMARAIGGLALYLEAAALAARAAKSSEEIQQ